MTPDFYLGQGDAPLFSTTLVDQTGAPVLIQTATVTLTMTPLAGGAAVLSSVAMVNDDDGTTPNKGKVHYQFGVGASSAWSGLYLVKIVATLASKPITFPNDGYLLFEVGPQAATQQRRYVGVDEFLASLEALGLSHLNHDADQALEAASRALEQFYNDGRQWTLGQAGEQRYYTRSGPTRVRLGDVAKITAIDLDYGSTFQDRWADIGGGSFGTSLPSSSYILQPVSPKHGLAADGGNGEPFERLELVRGSVIWYIPPGRNAVRVTGTFGWETVPSGVKYAVQLAAERLMRRARDAPFGIISFGDAQTVAAVRDICKDPDIAFAVGGAARREVRVR